MKRLLISFACGLLAASDAAAEQPAAPKLAVINRDADPALADLLTAELSGVTLLERGEIDRVLGEQQLSAAGLTLRRSPGVGALLGADGLLFLGTEKAGGKEVLATRLIAVHPGVIVGAWQGAAPPADPAAWSRETAAAVKALLPKLAVTREAAIPISVVNLRATRSRPEAAELESELALLLIHRLAHEPAFFVLERQGMEALLAEEREEASAFWTGRYLLDGTIEQTVTDADQLTIRAQLQPPGGAPGVPIEHTCRRTELRGAADFLAREIARKLQREPAATPWDAVGEAEQFWRDAQWAFGNELFARAAVAGESAWALGQRTPEVLTLRVRAHLLAARPELVLPYRYPKNYQYLRDYLAERNSFWRAHLSFTRGYRTPDVLAKIFQEMPEPERQARMARTQRGLELFRDHCAELLAEHTGTPLAAEALTIGGAMLEWFHDNRVPWDHEMRRLAWLLREVDKLATGRVCEFAKRPGHPPPPNFWQSKVALTPLWAASAAETLATYRAALRQPFDAKMSATLRITMVHSRDLFPALAVSGTGAVNQKLWSGFVKELLTSEFIGDRWTALLFQYETAPTEPEKEALTVKLRDSFWAERARFATPELPFTYFELLRNPRPAPGGGWPERDFHIEFLLYLLRESTPIDREAFYHLFQPQNFTEAQARDVYEAMLAHETRVRAKIGAHWMHSVLRERGEEILLRFPSWRRATPTDGVLKVTRYWTPYRLPQFLDGSLKAADLDFKGSIYREGRLWAFATFQREERGPDVKQPQFIFGIDLKTFETDAVAFEEPPPLASPRKDHWGGANLEISPDAVFVSKDWQLSRHDRREKTWRHFTEMPGVWEQPWLIGGRLYVRLNNSPNGFQGQHFGEMVEVDPQSGASVLLVSDRRTPAQSPIDTWGLSWLTLRPGANGRVLFCGIASDGSSTRRYAAYDPMAKHWEPLDESAWKEGAGAGSDAHMAAANSAEGAWRVEERRGGTDALSLKRGKLRVPFRCEMSDADGALLIQNGGNPKIEIIEQNLMPGHGIAPLCYETPEGLVISQVFRMPGFWFIPAAELEAVSKEPARPAPEK